MSEHNSVSDQSSSLTDDHEEINQDVDKEKQTSQIEETFWQMLERNLPSDQSSSSTDDNEEINQDVDEEKQTSKTEEPVMLLPYSSNHLNSDNNCKQHVENHKLPYIPYNLKEWILRFYNRGEYPIGNKNITIKPPVQINTGREASLISLKLAKKLQANIVYSKGLFVESYLSEQRIIPVGTCSLTIWLSGKELREVKFHVVQDNNITVVLGNSFYYKFFPSVYLQVNGPLAPLPAQGFTCKVSISGVEASAVDQNNYCERIRSVLLDTGCEVNLISRRFADSLGVTIFKSEDRSISFLALLTKLLEFIDPWRIIDRPFSGMRLNLKEHCFCDIIHDNCHDDKKEYRAVKFYVVDEISEPMVLGMQFILNHKRVDIKYCTKVITDDQLFIHIKHPVHKTQEEYIKKVRFQEAVEVIENISETEF